VDRQVTRCRKDRYGDILVLCNPGAEWSPRLKQDAIRDTESGLHTYFVRWVDGRRTEIRVARGPAGKYLRTSRDDTTRNSLEDLPDC
jgi:hypothetical protein